MSAPGEAKRPLQIVVPVGADDGDKIIIAAQGRRSAFNGKQPPGLLCSSRFAAMVVDAVQSCTRLMLASGRLCLHCSWPLIMQAGMD